MEFFKWVAIITAIVMSAECIKYYLKLKNKENQKDNSNFAAREELDSLKQRVENLEKIVSDPSESLKREINSL